MAHPGRPRGRMNKKTQQAQATAQAQAAAQAQAQAAARSQAAAQAHAAAQSRIKEEPGVQLHDEADLISFRADALNRYITNHEYIENATSKMVHTSKIIPPRLYPQLPKRDVLDIADLKPEDIVFGDLQMMKLKQKQLQREILDLKQDTNVYYAKYVPNDSKYNFHSNAVDKLSELQSKMYNQESLQDLENEVDKLLLEYKEQFNQTLHSVPAVKNYSVPVTSIDRLIQVTHAPPNYNPKLITSFININSGTANSAGTGIDVIAASIKAQVPTNGSGLNGGGSELMVGSIGESVANLGPQGALDTGNFNGNMYLNQFENGSSNNDYENNGNMASGFTMAMVNIDSIDNGTNNSSEGVIDSNNRGSNINSVADIQSGADSIHSGAGMGNDQNDDMVDDDMNAFLQDNDGDLDPNLAIVNDDMGGLINFEEDGDDGLMGGSAFDQDFLSQIDHSME